METPEKTKQGRQRFLVMALAAVLFVGLGVFALFTLKTGRFHPLVLLVLAAAVSLALPLVRSNFFPSARDCADEYDFHERRLDAQFRQWIADALGTEALGRIDLSSGRSSDAAEQACLALLETGPVRGDDNLGFALRMILARIYETGGDAERSIQYLSEALEVKPGHFIANFRLAMNHEWTGAPGAARHHYRRAADDPGGVSRGMARLVAAQIERLDAEAETEPTPAG
jgi:tetratricopeptide (TPR) repeat protein